MAGHELMGRIGIVMLVIALGEHVFLLRLEHGETADLLQITCETTFAAIKAWQSRLGHKSAPFHPCSCSRIIAANH